MQSNLEQIKKLIRTLPIEGYDKVRKALDSTENKKQIQSNTKIKRHLEVLRIFHDDFYNESKTGFMMEELKDAVNWVLTNYEV